MATMIRLVIRSVSQSSGQLTHHAERFFQYYPHRQHNVERKEPILFGGHLGSLGHVSVKYALSGEPSEVMGQIVDLFWRDHGLLEVEPSQRLKTLLTRLQFYELEDYFDTLETKLLEAADLDHPLIVRSGLSLDSIRNLKYRLLFGEVNYELLQIIEYFQSISNRFGGGLPVYPPNTALRFVRSTLSVGYTGGILLAFQAQAVQSLWQAYNLIDNFLLEDVSRPYELAVLFAHAADAFLSMGMFNFEHALEYAQSYSKISQAWLLQSGRPSIPTEGRIGFNLKEVTLELEPRRVYEPSAPIRTETAVVLLSAEQYIVSRQMAFTLTLISQTLDSVAMTLESTGDAEFTAQEVTVKANKPTQVYVDIEKAGYGSARAVGTELASNSLLYECIPLDFKP
jgi:hypothetical protein